MFVDQAERAEILSDEALESWVGRYDMRKQIRCDPEIKDPLSEPEVRKHSHKTRSG